MLKFCPFPSEIFEALITASALLPFVLCIKARAGPTSRHRCKSRKAHFSKKAKVRQQ